MASTPALGLVVKMKGLPFRATPSDICTFFSGFGLPSEAVYIKRHADGRPQGEAFVLFDSPDEARRATQKDRETFSSERFGDRYVRVYPALESDRPDLQQAIAQQAMPIHQGNGHSSLDSVVKVKSLPFDATQLDVIHFFDAFRLQPNGVQLVVRADNKPTGEAFVDFESSDEAARAVRERDHKVFCEDKFGDRYVRLIQVSRKEMQATLALRFGGEGILKMKGIPFKAGAADVRRFFAGFRIKPDGVSFIMHSDGRPSGMAFIEFETPQEAVRAMDKDRAKFGPEYGDRFCMLQLVGRHEMDKVQLQHEGDMIMAAGGGLAPNGPASQLPLLGGLNGLNGINMNMLQGLQGLLASHQAQAMAQHGTAIQPLLAAQAAAVAAAAVAAANGNGGANGAPPPWMTGAPLSPTTLAQLAAAGGLLNAQNNGGNPLARTNPLAAPGALPMAPSPVSPVPPAGLHSSSSSSVVDATLAAQLGSNLSLDAVGGNGNAGGAGGMGMGMPMANPLLMQSMYGMQQPPSAAPWNAAQMGAAAGFKGMAPWASEQLAVAAAAARHVNGGFLPGDGAGY